jgi:hypothetical protein
MKYASGGILAKTGETVDVEVAIKTEPAPQPAPPAPGMIDKRLRVSVWLDHPATCIGRWIDVKTGKFQEDRSMIQAAKGALDDITCLSTIWFSKTKGVTWKVDSVPMFLQKAIDACHENGIQFFAGYSIGDEGGMTGTRSKLFKDWIRNPVGPTLEQHAQDICEFLFEKNGFDVDGIGFDLELNGLKAEDADNFIRFYGALADLLAAKNKVLSIATGVGNVNNEASWLGTFRAQPFRIAKGKPNIIIRPMAYDNFVLSDDQFLQWHKDIIDFALNKVGLAPGNLQLGLKTSKNVHSQDQSWMPPQGWTERKCTFDAAGIADRCKTLLKPNNVGVVTFAGWNDFASFDKALNEGREPAGTPGTPLQGPRAGGTPAPPPVAKDAPPVAKDAEPPTETKKDALKEDKAKDDNPRLRLSAWTRTRELFYADPKKGGVPDFARAAQFLDACKDHIDDLVLLNTYNIQVPKPDPAGTPTGKVNWDSDFYLFDDKCPELAKKLVDECHKRGIALHAGYAVVDDGNNQGPRGKAFRKFMETASADQIKDHCKQMVTLLDAAGFDGVSFDLEINGLSTKLHAANIEALFKELSAQMLPSNKILSYAPYPFTKDGDASSLPNMNAAPFSLCKLGDNILARPQAYRSKGESMSALKTRLGKTIDCALKDVGLPPSKFQIGIDYTGDNTFDAVRGDDMSDICKLARTQKIGVCIWRLEWPGSPTAADVAKWDKAMNDGAPVPNTVGQPLQVGLSVKLS